MKIILLILSLLSTKAEEIKFNQLIEEGTVIPHKDNEWDTFDRPMYTLLVSDTIAIEYAYKAEIKEWIRTGDFQYNDFLKD